MTDWLHPHSVSDVDLAFPARALEIMPSMEECEEGLAALSEEDQFKWVDFQHRWFFNGLPSTLQVALATNNGEKVDGNRAFRHLKVIQGSYAPKHEHKKAAVAYLASLWFEDIAWGGFEVTDDKPCDCGAPTSVKGDLRHAEDCPLNQRNLPK